LRSPLGYPVVTNPPTYLRLDVQHLQFPTLRRRHIPLGQLLLFQEDLQVHRNALEAQHVIAIRGYLDLQLWWLRLVLWLRAQARVLVQLDSEFETQVVELLVRVFSSQLLEERRLVDRDCRHLERVRMVGYVAGYSSVMRGLRAMLGVRGYS
jgi:hypothetical protein